MAEETKVKSSTNPASTPPNSSETVQKTAGEQSSEQQGSGEQNNDGQTQPPVVEGPAPNVAFVGLKGDKSEYLVETSFQNGMLKKIQMPSVEEQLAGPFFHERANEIVRISPYYKAVKPKG